MSNRTDIATHQILRRYLTRTNLYFQHNPQSQSSPLSWTTLGLWPGVLIGDHVRTHQVCLFKELNRCVYQSITFCCPWLISASRIQPIAMSLHLCSVLWYILLQPWLAEKPGGLGEECNRTKQSFDGFDLSNFLFLYVFEFGVKTINPVMGSGPICLTCCKWIIPDIYKSL